MNMVALIGRLTKDPEVRFTSEQKPVARATLAVQKMGNEADFINITAFGKVATLMEKYCSKGKQIAVTGRIQTSSYTKDGKKLHTVEVVVDKMDFLSKGETKPDEEMTHVEGFSPFSHVDDVDIPF